MQDIIIIIMMVDLSQMWVNKQDPHRSIACVWKKQTF